MSGEPRVGLPRVGEARERLLPWADADFWIVAECRTLGVLGVCGVKEFDEDDEEPGRGIAD